MDRRSFMLGLAASTAAVPIAKLAVPAVVNGWTPGVMYEVGDVVELYGRSAMMEVWPAVVDLQTAVREFHRVMALPPEYLR